MDFSENKKEMLMCRCQLHDKREEITLTGATKLNSWKCTRMARLSYHVFLNIAITRK